jgi:hypothetical protein
VFGFRQDVRVVVASQVSFEAMDATQVQLTASDHAEQNREAPSGACGSDALAGGRFGHTVPRHAKVEHGWVPAFGPEFAPIDGVDVPKQACRTLLVLLH